MPSNSEEVPLGWTMKISKSRGIPYYINDYTNETQWELPMSEAKMPNKHEVQVRHILKKHKGSRRPSSWRQEKITQSKEDAITQILAFKQQLEDILKKDGYDAMHQLFINIARAESDCSSAQKGGDLGFFGRGQMQKAFEDASFSIDAQCLTENIVDTDSGIHIILRIA